MSGQLPPDLRVCLLGCLLLLAGCDGSVPTNSPATWNPVKVVVLPDGTRCAVIDGSNGGGIDCDWQSERVEK